ncbi:hypothetical protein B0T26DRAFT_478808 [Lasiosphaeria miniovina]|uniref:Uncharacterized protein n=1 Tax=Lasiosphaeria miniovina TaxID=1954250 RepID=A0AA40DKD5_9PEZI|nr:uncharacterized protein B0T26DRAFT_478808 [Lasiosphaeria miniovina]KAK0706894.1 hypothetical protein B0T26DRAFT_478808 [Lasiosphaeria miniovina]
MQALRPRKALPDRPTRPTSTNTPIQPRRLKRARHVVEQQGSGELVEIERQIRAVDKHCKTPSIEHINPPGPDIFKLAAALWSRPAINQFCSLIRSRRDPSFRFTSTGEFSTRIKACYQGITIADRKVILNIFLLRYHQVRLARYVEQTKQGTLRADPKLLANIRQDLGLKKAEFDNHLKTGQKWIRICAPCDGLLCFIFISGDNKFGISPTSYLAMTSKGRSAFHRLVFDDEYTTHLHNLGKVFQDSLDSIVEDVEFRLESICPLDLEQLSEPDLLSSFESPRCKTSTSRTSILVGPNQKVGPTSGHGRPIPCRYQRGRCSVIFVGNQPAGALTLPCSSRVLRIVGARDAVSKRSQVGPGRERMREEILSAISPAKLCRYKLTAVIESGRRETRYPWRAYCLSNPLCGYW